MASPFDPWLKAYRIADRRHPIFDSMGSFLQGGRWNSPGQHVIYGAETYAGAQLEILVHANIGRLPKNAAWVEILIPRDVRVEEVTEDTVPDWHTPSLFASRTFGDAWLKEKRSAAIFVPSLVARGVERNMLFNPRHPDFARMAVSEPRDVLWHPELHARAKPSHKTGRQAGH